MTERTEGSLLREQSDSDFNQIVQMFESAAAEEGAIRSGVPDALAAIGVAASGGIALVAEVSGMLVGHLLIAATPSGDMTGELAVFVQENWRSRGVGRQLLSEGMHRARDLGMTELTLRVSLSNESALHLYESLGFETSHGREDGTVVMVKELRVQKS